MLARRSGLPRQPRRWPHTSEPAPQVCKVGTEKFAQVKLAAMLHSYIPLSLYKM